MNTQHPASEFFENLGQLVFWSIVCAVLVTALALWPQECECPDSRSVPQLVEDSPDKRAAPGSTPGGPTK